ncbi:DUF2784 family protein [Luteimonas sp. MHLX1A]|uniref:DUF2784 family protein n=1 Tax=Alterluteimonas muca TaxID=2878684 RepID=UPI001E2EC424|nr:DUF2784 domain-containing protein [Luteimonas sp. MHLX1A]
MQLISPALAAHLADAVLALHAGIALFAVAVLGAVLIGGPLGWRWVRHAWLRRLHLALLAVVALQAWLGRLCPLTVWEQALRTHAGQSTHAGSFVEYWLSRLLFFEAPWWTFIAAYSLAVGLTVLAWWRWPPLRRS